MLRGHESLIRLVGKRQRNLSLKNVSSHPSQVQSASECNITSSNLIKPAERADMTDEARPAPDSGHDWVECPVCTKRVRSNDVSINEHLDLCLTNGKKRRRIQLTLYQFDCSKNNRKPEDNLLNAVSEDGSYEELFSNSNAASSHEEIKRLHPDALAKGCNPVIGIVGSQDSISVTDREAQTETNFQETYPLKSKVLEGSSYSGCLETQIVGRKFHREAKCDVGMEVLMVREPENPKDAYAIKVFSAEYPDGPPLGHIPRNLALHLSSLLDQNILHIKGYVTAVPEHVSGAVAVKLTCNELEGRVIGSPSEEKALTLSWENVMNIVASNKENTSTYQQNFLYLLDTVLQRHGHLFSSEESTFLGSFRSLSNDAQRLFVRLSQRKGPWFRVRNIFYEDVAHVDLAVQELAGNGFFIAGDVHWMERSPEAVMEVLQVLTVQELRQVICNANVMKKADTSMARRDELVASLSDALLRAQPILTSVNGRSTVFNFLLEMTGLCIRISETTMFLLWRLQRLFFLNGEQELQVFLLVDMGKIKYPKYNCTRTMPVFATREALLSYEQALQLAQVVDMSLEANDRETLMYSLKRARSELEMTGNAEFGYPFLLRFSAAWVYTSICTLAVSIFERERRYTEAVDLLKKLLSMKYCPGRRGYWTVRLSMDLEHLGRLEESLQAAENGLNDHDVRGGDRIALQRRVLRLGKPPRRWRIPPYAAMMKKKHKVVHITGRPLNNVIGMKSRFYGYDGQQCGVEELALQYYAAEDGGGWKGVHSESGVWLTLFGLLMWDIIFSDVPDVFQTPFQTAPLDLDTDAFYPVRSSLIESRLQVIGRGGAMDIISQTWTQNYGTHCRGVSWEKYPLEELQTIAVCIGGPGLSAICKLLAEDHASWTAGMPDLLLWRTSTSKLGEVKLVEVKGPGDRLSEQQVAWFFILSNAGVPVEVCKVSKQVR